MNEVIHENVFSIINKSILNLAWEEYIFKHIEFDEDIF